MIYVLNITKWFIVCDKRVRPSDPLICSLPQYPIPPAVLPSVGILFTNLGS